MLINDVNKGFALLPSLSGSNVFADYSKDVLKGTKSASWHPLMIGARADLP
jgi:hypothetical protein